MAYNIKKAIYYMSMAKAGQTMKGYFKHCLMQYLNSQPSLNKKAVNMKRSFDEVNKIVQKLGAPPKRK